MAMTTATEQPYRNLPQGSRVPDPLPPKGYFSYVPNESWRPNANLYESDAAYLICVDLAGVVKEEIAVEVVDQTLHIRGKRAVPTPENEKPGSRPRLRIHLMEIDHGEFSREVELPADVIAKSINATYRNGMLWIELPKKR
jgi:HSP20 family protein